jgi:hypothetical protein
MDSGRDHGKYRLSMPLVIPYYPTANRAMLRPGEHDWYIWLERPHNPAEACVVQRDEVVVAIGNRADDPDEAIAWVERCLNSVGYATTGIAPPAGHEGFIAAWALAPGTN